MTVGCPIGLADRLIAARLSDRAALCRELMDMVLEDSIDENLLVVVITLKRRERQGFKSLVVLSERTW